MSGYEIASLTELESVPAVGTLRWTPLRKHFGITAFGISAYTAAEAGQDVVEEHTRRRSATRSSTSSSPAGRRSSSTARRRRCPRARSSSCAIRR